jgi:hypothetical protein
MTTPEQLSQQLPAVLELLDASGRMSTSDIARHFNLPEDVVRSTLYRCGRQAGLRLQGDDWSRRKAAVGAHLPPDADSAAA